MPHCLYTIAHLFIQEKTITKWKQTFRKPFRCLVRARIRFILPQASLKPVTAPSVRARTQIHEFVTICYIKENWLYLVAPTHIHLHGLKPSYCWRSKRNNIAEVIIYSTLLLFSYCRGIFFFFRFHFELFCFLLKLPNQFLFLNSSYYKHSNRFSLIIFYP